MALGEDKKAIPVIFSSGSLYPFGLDRSYGWAAEVGYDRVEIMMDERWDTHQHAYLSHLADRHDIPVLALHTPLYGGAWRLEPGETLVRSAGLAEKIGAPVVVVHPPPLGRPGRRSSCHPAPPSPPGPNPAGGTTPTPRQTTAAPPLRTPAGTGRSDGALGNRSSGVRRTLRGHLGQPVEKWKVLDPGTAW